LATPRFGRCSSEPPRRHPRPTRRSSPPRLCRRPTDYEDEGSPVRAEARARPAPVPLHPRRAGRSGSAIAVQLQSVAVATSSLSFEPGCCPLNQSKVSRVEHVSPQPYQVDQGVVRKPGARQG
jgi:hypothetical protein